MLEKRTREQWQWWLILCKLIAFKVSQDSCAVKLQMHCKEFGWLKTYNFCQARVQVQRLSQISNKRPGPGACRIFFFQYIAWVIHSCPKMFLTFSAESWCLVSEMYCMFGLVCRNKTADISCYIFVAADFNIYCIIFCNFNYLHYNTDRVTDWFLFLIAKFGNF